MYKKLINTANKLSNYIVAHTDDYLKNSYSEYKKSHPKSKMTYNHFKTVRSRSGIQTSVSSGDILEKTEGNALLDKTSLEHHLKNGSFSMMSAENPTGKDKPSPEENKNSTENLHKKLDEIGAVYHEAKGHYSGEENSVMVHHSKNVTPEKLQELANSFDQESILHSTGGHHKLHHLRDDSKHLHGEGHVMGDNLEDFYSKIKGSDEKVRMHVSSTSKRKGCYTIKHPSGTESHIKLSLG